MTAKRVTTWTVRRRRELGEPLVMVTAYDATFARLAESADVDIILVGDSLGHVIQGLDSTIPVTLGEMIYHCRCVTRVTQRAMVVGDLPFGSYQSSVRTGIRSAERLLKEGGVQAVKLEGGQPHVELVQKLTQMGVPVMGHLGLTPQSVHAFGGYRVQGRNEEAALTLLEDARALEVAGAFSLVLECVPAELAKRVREAISIPTIGIGAGPHCDGQVLVIYDLLGMNDGFQAKFVKRYDSLGDKVASAVRAFGEEVRTRAFPTNDHSFE